MAVAWKKRQRRRCGVRVYTEIPFKIPSVFWSKIVSVISSTIFFNSSNIHLNYLKYLITFLRILRKFLGEFLREFFKNLCANLFGLFLEFRIFFRIYAIIHLHFCQQITLGKPSNNCLKISYAILPTIPFAMP